MADIRTITVTVNGQAHSRAVETRMTLADFLRHELELTGTHVGCEHGACGACTVLVGGASVRACLMLAVQCDGADVVTVEALAQDGRLNALQQAFQEHHGLQCGFCTPGMLMTLTEFLREHPDPNEIEVREALTGNLCRCTGYQAIVAAALDAAKCMRETGSPSPPAPLDSSSPPFSQGEKGGSSLLSPLGREVGSEGRRGDSRRTPVGGRAHEVE
jgi:carbon-monoxide dehydrogenase small subunit